MVGRAAARRGGYDHYAREALGRIGSKEAMVALREATKGNDQLVASAARHVEEFRDRPEVFRFQVDAYLTAKKPFASLLRGILADDEIVRWDEELPPKKVPPYEGMPLENAHVYVQELDKLLAHKGKRPLTPEERGRVLQIRAVMAEKAEEYKREHQKPPE